MADKKEEFLEIFDSRIRREGAQELRNYLLRSDFFKAPASMRYHCAFEGGLCEHSVNTYKRLLKNVMAEYGEEWEKTVPHESVAVCGLLHDLCKIDFYKEDFRNVKENGEWVRKPCYAREEVLPYGHGEKSVYIAHSFIKLTREEAMAINCMWAVSISARKGAIIRSAKPIANILWLFFCMCPISRLLTLTKKGNIKNIIPFCFEKSAFICALIFLLKEKTLRSLLRTRARCLFSFYEGKILPNRE